MEKSDLPPVNAPGSVTMLQSQVVNPSSIFPRTPPGTAPWQHPQGTAGPRLPRASGVAGPVPAVPQRGQPLLAHCPTVLVVSHLGALPIVPAGALGKLLLIF